MSTSGDQVIHDLLEQPFGPYLDEKVLSDKCKFTHTKPIVLEDLMLSYNDQPTGFDRTEFEDNFVPDSAKRLEPIANGARVLFRGVFTIGMLVYLSETGLHYLNRDLQERAVGSTLGGRRSLTKYTNLTIEDILGPRSKYKGVADTDQYRVKVLVQGFRNFRVDSMHVETYKLSRTFLFRYHTLWTMREIIKIQSEGVLPIKRTPEWFVTNYLAASAYPVHRLWRRINYLEDAETTDEGSDGERDKRRRPIGRPPDAQTRRKRLLRKVHSNEVRSIFASHVEWICRVLETNRDLRNKVNAHSWRKFLEEVPELRRRARNDATTNRRWGLRDEVDPIDACVPSDEDTEMVDVPRDSPPPVRKRKSRSDSQSTHAPASVQKRRRKSTPERKSPLKKSATPARLSRTATSSKPPSRPTFIPAPEQALESVQYDSDFSDASTPPASPSSSRAGSPTLMLSSLDSRLPLNPEIWSLVPDEVLRPPVLPPDLHWYCPLGGGTCPYSIDMYAPSEDELRILRTCGDVPLKDINDLRRKEFKSDEERVYLMFCELVSAHWDVHLAELDIKHVVDGPARGFAWIHPERHSPWPPKRWLLMRARRQSNPVHVKRESVEL
ncbi:hypothetical protein BC834DRAFT_965512 [Gloeopeniophorella convolvens]|nr:hypothetical protein BC834DRAFT_965512 [Gloeopeniophorella convolvens]